MDQQGAGEASTTPTRRSNRYIRGSRRNNPGTGRRGKCFQGDSRDRCAGDTAANEALPGGRGPAYLEVELAGPLSGEHECFPAPKEMIMAFTLPDLPYPHDALAPFMSKETLEFHHDKHHQAYVTNGNNALKGTEWEGKPLEEIVKGSFGKNPAVFNNAGQHYNHIHFWKWMKKGGGGDKMPAKLQAAVDKDLGGVAKAKADFIAAGVGQFGSGWCWIAVKDGKLMIDKTPNGESPLVKGASPILGCDVWEHSYYIDYRNAPPEISRGVLGQPDQLGPRRGDVRRRARLIFLNLSPLAGRATATKGRATRIARPFPFRSPARAFDV